VAEPPRFDHGYAIAPDRPGLGIELDDRRVERLRLR
jgi:L-alanine-DL-glutamate epimerase-like enolase superfamily enzyme